MLRHLHVTTFLSMRFWIGHVRAQGHDSGHAYVTMRFVSVRMLTKHYKETLPSTLVLPPNEAPPRFP